MKFGKISRLTDPNLEFPSQCKDSVNEWSKRFCLRTVYKHAKKLVSKNSMIKFHGELIDGMFHKFVLIFTHVFTCTDKNEKIKCHIIILIIRKWPFLISSCNMKCITFEINCMIYKIVARITVVFMHWSIWFRRVINYYLFENFLPCVRECYKTVLKDVDVNGQEILSPPRVTLNKNNIAKVQMSIIDANKLSHKKKKVFIQLRNARVEDITL